ncbi:hypothetical protein SAMN05428988_0764 [Chitinophaga sp. YR573]|uniref:hypothetical protein n=1 Tax=Chitinophaga sp. YR573 TaxID=1881040 RepID=UPI0008D11EA8|nr:hypothetical protein [Chitinophaga sp. YR573]SEV95504.1 hypothetical protein SAMN05428988_0764 [Chitinophaga sp. YR573]
METFIEELLFAMQQQNLVYNSDFRYYSNKVINGNNIDYKTPDGWLYDDPGRNGKIGFDPATNRCIIFKSEDNSLMRFSQALHEFPRWQQMLYGKKITAKIKLSISTVSDVSVTLSDGIDASTVTKKGIGDFEIDVQLVINSKSTSILLSVESKAPFVTIAIANVCANAGNIALKTLPCVVQGIIGERRQYISTDNPPAEELSLCNKSEELGADYTRLSSVINGRFGTGINKRSMLPDMRGYFSRAWDHGAGTDPDAPWRTPLGGTVKGDNVGTVEIDEFLTHDHQLSFSMNNSILGGKETAAVTLNAQATSNTKPVGGKETRPKNLAELYTIKWA